MEDMTHDEMLALAAAAAELDEWAEVVADRDPRIGRAHKAGMSKAEIARRLKIGRGTVGQVLGTDDESEGEQ
jgi:DNA-binding NarL/FixJ family response regulator